jgi:hypothetical protein
MSDQVQPHRRTPSALRFMSRGLMRSARMPGVPMSMPPLTERWIGLRLSHEQCRALAELTGGTDLVRVAPILIPQIIGFRLQMCLLTRRTFPFPIWNALQVRSRLVQIHPIEVDGRMAKLRFSFAHLRAQAGHVSVHELVRGVSTQRAGGIAPAGITVAMKR